MARILWLLKCAVILLIADKNLANSTQLVKAMSSVAKSFEAFKVVPDMLTKAPNVAASVQYPSGVSANEGNVLTPTQVKDKPTVTWDADPDAFYTLSMTDPDTTQQTDSKSHEWQHWLITNIKGNDMAVSDQLYDYIGSGPRLGSGLHRYVFLVYKQPGKLTFDDPILTDKSLLNRSKYSISEFAKKYKLGDPIAGNFYRAEYDDYVPQLYKELQQKYNL